MNEAIRLLLLSDPHLFANPEGNLRGVKTLASLQCVLGAAAARKLISETLAQKKYVTALCMGVAVLADAAGLGGTDAEYRAKASHFFRQHRDHAFIALLKYKDGTLAYILAPQRLAVGDSVISGDKVDVKPGNTMPLAAISTIDGGDDVRGRCLRIRLATPRGPQRAREPERPLVASDEDGPDSREIVGRQQAARRASGHRRELAGDAVFGKRRSPAAGDRSE